MWVHLAIKSGNRKVGAIPISTTEEDSCPRECPLHGTDCYARFSFLGIHWRAVSNGKRGGNWTGFCNRVRKFVSGQRWRHNEAGDLPKRKDGRIAKRLLRQLSKAATHTRGWTYTHYDPTDEHNAEAIAETNQRGGMTINLSADNLHQADDYMELGIGPVVTILPQDADHRGNTTPGGLPIVVCPAQTQDDMTCEECMLCEVRDRKSIVGFLAHGAAKKRLSKSVSLVQLGGDE